MDNILLEKIKKLTLRALVGDEILMKGLVLKGGNALQMAYDITSRGSIDIDFSISNDFSESDKLHIHVRLEILLNIVFEKEGLKVFDVNFFEKPKANKVKEWKGYCIEFKTIELNKFNSMSLEQSRITAIAVNPNNSTKFTVDISSYEYTDGKKLKEIDGAVMYVYTPEMILFEKIRALCQTIPEYQTIIKSANVKGASYVKALYRATVAGARALKLDKSCGNFESGKYGNLIIVNAPKDLTGPSEKILERIVSSCKSSRKKYDKVVEQTFYRGECVFSKI